jgi:hypothetical protein
MPLGSGNAHQEEFVRRGVPSHNLFRECRYWVLLRDGGTPLSPRQVIRRLMLLVQLLVQDSKDAVAILKEKKPDACIITTASLMQDLKGPFMDCAESGVNAITRTAPVTDGPARTLHRVRTGRPLLTRRRRHGEETAGRR